MGEPEPVAPDRDPIEPDEQAIALRALDFSKLPNAGTDAENWERARLELREERQMTAERAAQIAQTRGSGDAVSDWLRAERQIQAEHRLIAERAGHAWAGTPRWLRAEQELTGEGIIPLPDDI